MRFRFLDNITSVMVKSMMRRGDKPATPSQTYIDRFYADELRAYGRESLLNDTAIRVPSGFTFFSGLHVHENELARLGIIDPTSPIPEGVQVLNFQNEVGDFYKEMEVAAKVNPRAVFTPQNLEDKSVFCGVGERGILRPASEKFDLVFPYRWQDLWLSLDYSKPATPQVFSYMENNITQFMSDKLQRINSQVVAEVMHDPFGLKSADYALENGKPVDVSTLKGSFMAKEVYQEAHRNLIIACHDVLIEYDGGLLLVQRDNLPATGILWPIGGRMLRGMSATDSLKKKVKDECGLDLEDKVVDLGWDRTYFETDPFGHGKGTDTVNQRFYAKGTGTLKLNEIHSRPTIVKPSDYTPQFRSSLHPYVQDFMDVAIRFVGHKEGRAIFPVPMAEKL